MFINCNMIHNFNDLIHEKVPIGTESTNISYVIKMVSGQ